MNGFNAFTGSQIRLPGVLACDMLARGWELFYDQNPATPVAKMDGAQLMVDDLEPGWVLFRSPGLIDWSLKAHDVTVSVGPNHVIYRRDRELERLGSLVQTTQFKVEISPMGMIVTFTTGMLSYPPRDTWQDVQMVVERNKGYKSYVLEQAATVIVDHGKSLVENGLRELPHETLEAVGILFPIEGPLSEDVISALQAAHPEPDGAGAPHWRDSITLRYVEKKGVGCFALSWRIINPNFMDTVWLKAFMNEFGGCLPQAVLGCPADGVVSLENDGNLEMYFRDEDAKLGWVQWPVVEEMENDAGLALYSVEQFAMIMRSLDKPLGWLARGVASSEHSFCALRPVSRVR